jgi:hypothetical protein
MEVCTADEVLKTMQPGLYTSAIVFLQTFLNANLNYDPETRVKAQGPVILKGNQLNPHDILLIAFFYKSEPRSTKLETNTNVQNPKLKTRHMI